MQQNCISCNFLSIIKILQIKIFPGVCSQTPQKCHKPVKVNLGSAPAPLILWQGIPDKSVSSFNSLLQKRKPTVEIDKLMVEKSNRMSRKNKSYGEEV